MKTIPPFFMQITDANGVVVRSRQGKHERNLKEALKAKMLSKGVGIFRTQAHVIQALDEAVDEVVADLRVQDPINVYD